MSALHSNCSNIIKTVIKNYYYVVHFPINILLKDYSAKNPAY